MIGKTKAADIFALAILAGGAIVVWAVFRGISIDDPYITYRYARNLADGVGLVYNPGESVLSTTSPLYAVILALTTVVSRDLPATSNFLSGLGLFGAASSIYLLGRRFQERALGFIAALFFAASPFTIGSIGLETNLYLSLILAGYLAYCHGRLNLTALCLALAFLVRGDAFIFIFLVCVHYLVRERRIPLQPLALFSIITLPFLAYLVANYGTPLPMTMAAKQAQLRIGWMDYAQGFLHWSGTYLQQSWLYALAIPLAALGLFHSTLNARWLLLPVLWGILYAVSYQYLAVASYYWYYAPLVPAIALLCAAGLSVIFRGFLNRLPALSQKWSFAYPVLLLVSALPLLAAEATTMDQSLKELPDAKAELYTEAGNWLRANTPEDATVGVMEVGIMGYYAQRRMVDFLGLIRPASIEALRHKDIFWSVYHYQPDYLVLTHVNPLWGYPIYIDKWFQDAYQPIKQFVDERFWASPLIVYKRVMPARPEPAVVENVDLDFGGQLRLVKFAADRTALQPGQYLSVALFWSKADDVAKDYAVTAQLIGADGRLLAQDDVTTATTYWAPGRVAQYYHHIKVPDASAEGDYQLRIAAYFPANPDERLPVLNGPSSSSLDKMATLTTVKVRR